MHTVTVIPLTKFHLAVVMLWEQTWEQKVNDRKCMFIFMIQVRRSITPTLIPVNYVSFCCCCCWFFFKHIMLYCMKEVHSSNSISLRDWEQLLKLEHFYEKLSKSIIELSLRSLRSFIFLQWWTCTKLQFFVASAGSHTKAHNYKSKTAGTKECNYVKVLHCNVIIGRILSTTNRTSSQNSTTARIIIPRV